MATAQERLNEWLRDAHAAEEQAYSMLTGTAAYLDDYPELRAFVGCASDDNLRSLK